MIHTRKTLDALPCPSCREPLGAGGCQMQLHSRCHPDSPLVVVYGGGVLKTFCASCDAPVSEFIIAAETVQ